MAVDDGAHLALYNDREEVLLQHRSKHARRFPDHWGLFGGRIEKGETPEQALAREIFEELEYKVKAPVLVVKQKTAWNDIRRFEYVFAEKYDASQSLVQHEGQEMIWRRFDNLDNLLVADYVREELLKVARYIGSVI